MKSDEQKEFTLHLAAGTDPLTAITARPPDDDDDEPAAAPVPDASGRRAWIAGSVLGTIAAALGLGFLNA